MKTRLMFAVVLAVALSACSTSVEDAQAAYCDDLHTLFVTMGGITGEPNMEPSTSVDIVKTYASNVADAYEDVASSARDLDDAVTDEVEAARSDFLEAVDTLPDNGTISEVFEQFRVAWGTYVFTVGETLVSLGCEALRGE